MKGEMYYQDPEGDYHYIQMYESGEQGSVSKLSKYSRNGYISWIKWGPDDVNAKAQWYRYIEGQGHKMKEIPKELMALDMLHGDTE